MRQRLKRIHVGLATLFVLACAAQASGASTEVPRVISVSLPGSGTVDIQIDHYENHNKNAGNKAVLAVHGLAHTGATFDQLANELFKQTGNDKVRRVLALNFPGRNGSGVPSKGEFGSLSVEDYTAVLLGVLDQLSKKINIETIVAHSLGALIVQTAQNSLTSAGTSLQKEFGIKNVYLLAPSIPNPQRWLLAESGAFLAIAAGVIDDDPNLGSFLRLLSDNPVEQQRLLEIWLGLFFRNRSGQLVAGAPVTTALALNYISNEALVVTLQLLGAGGFARPFVNAGIFRDSVQKCFRLVSFSEDLAVPGENLLQEHQDLADYLTGNPQAPGVIFIDAPDAVHDMYIANPMAVAKALTSCN